MISQVFTEVTPIAQTLRRSVPAKGINVMEKIAQLLSIIAKKNQTNHIIIIMYKIGPNEKKRNKSPEQIYFVSVLY